ncbi:MAG: DUF459 domain-containing protein [Candidatus Gribaldobacteria bacterium]|nr:DUF459 domain-containing protein [Candidatus Gribaldobacteria bacterium]
MIFKLKVKIFLVLVFLMIGGTSQEARAVLPLSQDPASASTSVRYLLIGDSFMDTYSPVGDLLKKTLVGYASSSVIRFGKVSSGLARPDFFDWSKKAQELVQAYQPNVVVVMLGANDDQNLKVTGTDGQKRYLTFGSLAWEEEYGRRVASLIKTFQDRGSLVFWVGMPITRDLNRFSRYTKVNIVCQKQANQLTGAYYISTWRLLSNSQGDYLGFLPDAKGKYQPTHAPDGIHLSFFAGGLLVKKIIGQIEVSLLQATAKWHILSSK